jgi:hypothetical protein
MQNIHISDKSDGTEGVALSMKTREVRTEYLHNMKNA